MKFLDDIEDENERKNLIEEYGFSKSNKKPLADNTLGNSIKLETYRASSTITISVNFITTTTFNMPLKAIK